MLSSLTQTSLCLTWNTSRQVQQRNGLTTVSSHVHFLSGDSRGWVLFEMCHCFCAQVWYLHAVARFACVTEEGVYMGTFLVVPLIHYLWSYTLIIRLFLKSNHIQAFTLVLKIFIWVWIEGKYLIEYIKPEQSEAHLYEIYGLGAEWIWLLSGM